MTLSMKEWADRQRQDAQCAKLFHLRVVLENHLVIIVIVLKSPYTVSRSSSDNRLVRSNLNFFVSESSLKLSRSLKILSSLYPVIVIVSPLA